MPLWSRIPGMIPLLKKSCILFQRHAACPPPTKPVNPPDIPTRKSCAFRHNPLNINGGRCGARTYGRPAGKGNESFHKALSQSPNKKATLSDGYFINGGRCGFRTCGLCRVKAVLKRPRVSSLVQCSSFNSEYPRCRGSPFLVYFCLF